MAETKKNLLTEILRWTFVASLVANIIFILMLRQWAGKIRVMSEELQISNEKIISLVQEANRLRDEAATVHEIVVTNFVRVDGLVHGVDAGMARFTNGNRSTAIDLYTNLGNRIGN